MPAPKFETLDAAARFVVTHHRLPTILSVEDVGQFIRFIYDAAGGDASLPFFVLAFFRGKIQRIDEEMEG